MRVVRGSQQQRGGVDRAAGHEKQRRLDPKRLTIALDFDGLDFPPGGIGDQAAGVRIRPQPDIWPLYRVTDAADIGVALGVDLTGERVARVAEDAAVRL